MPKILQYAYHVVATTHNIMHSRNKTFTDFAVLNHECMIHEFSDAMTGIIIMIM